VKFVVVAGEFKAVACFPDSLWVVFEVGGGEKDSD